MYDSSTFALVTVFVLAGLLVGLPAAQRRLSAVLAPTVECVPSRAWSKLTLFLASFSIMLVGHGAAIASCFLWMSSCHVEIVQQSAASFNVLGRGADVTITALLEEMIFRGFLLALLMKWVGVITANRLQAAAFAIIHPLTVPDLSILSIVPYYLLGLGFGYLAIRDRGLARACIAHAAFNLSLVVIGTTALQHTTADTLFLLQVSPLAWLLGGAYWVATVVLVAVFNRTMQIGSVSSQAQVGK